MKPPRLVYRRSGQTDYMDPVIFGLSWLRLQVCTYNGRAAGASELPAEYLRYAVNYVWPLGTSFDSSSGAHAVAIVHKRVRYLSCTVKMEDSARDTALQKGRSRRS
jgi:hypothetical protein